MIHYRIKREYLCPPLALVIKYKITINKNCKGITVPGGYSLFPGVMCSLWGPTRLFEKDWYIRALLRTIQAEIEKY